MLDFCDRMNEASLLKDKAAAEARLEKVEQELAQEGLDAEERRSLLRSRETWENQIAELTRQLGDRERARLQGAPGAAVLALPSLRWHDSRSSSTCSSITLPCSPFLLAIGALVQARS